MKCDLGDQQTEEVRQFYEKMSKQIKQICSTDGPENQAFLGQAGDPALKSQLMLSLIEFQKNKIIESSLLKSQEDQFAPFTVKFAPKTQLVKQTLKDRSKTETNPYIQLKIAPKEGQTVGDVFRYLAGKFQEAITKIVLHSEDGLITYQSHAELPITVLRSQTKYTYQFNGEELNLEEESEIPSDISEDDLVNMLTECMAIIILKNKDSKIVDAINLFNPEVQLPKPE